jgi:hypothetical protein
MNKTFKKLIGEYPKQYMEIDSEEAVIEYCKYLHIWEKSSETKAPKSLYEWLATEIQEGV